MSEPLTQTTPIDTAPPDTAPADTAVETDLPEAVRIVLEKSEDPVTLPKLRSSLPGRLRSVSLEALAEILRRQVAANVLYQYPKYRSQHERYWDRPMPVHVARVIRIALEEKPLALPDLRRKLPDYAKNLAEPVLNDEVAQGRLHRHPPASKRTGPRFGIRRPEPREYLRQELTQVLQKLEQLGFTQTQLREGALELLHEEEWASAPPEPPPQRERQASPRSEPMASRGLEETAMPQEPERSSAAVAAESRASESGILDY